MLLFTYELQLAVLARIEKRIGVYSELSIILDLLNDPIHIKQTINKYQRDLFGFLCTAFLVNDVQ